MTVSAASPANLTSDESLYLAEAHSIVRGEGLVYPSGEPITHRAPLYPLTLAYALAIGGDDAPYALAKTIVTLNALLVMALAWRIAGALAGMVAGFAAGASAYLNGLGTTLYLDPLQCTCLLVALTAIVAAIREQRSAWFAVAGFWTGLAFLLKESAIEWLPLAAAAWLSLPSLRSRIGARGVLMFTLVFVAVVTPWWIWVYVHTGELYLLGPARGVPMAIVLAGAGAFASFSAAVGAWPSLDPRVRERVGRAAPLAAPVLIAVWSGFMLYGLTRYATWPYPSDYLSAVPQYLRTVAPAAQPFLLLAVAWCIVAWRAARGNEGARLISVAALLFAPFALFVANRGLQLRDALPIVYLSYVALGVAAAYASAKLRESVEAPHATLMHAGLLIAGVAFAAHQTYAFRAANDDASSIGVRADSWDSSFAREIGGWMSANLPVGSNVLSSRLYFSSLHNETGGRFNIRQLPTVRVQVDARGDPLLTARSNLFRWEDGVLRPTGPNDAWLSLRRFPGKNYWVGLNQQELLEYIVAHEIDYIVLTGEDVAFSSLHYASYFSGHPAFTLLDHIHATGTDQLFAFAVNREELFAREYSLAIAPQDMAALESETGMTRDQIAAAVSVPIRVTDLDRGLSAREEFAAVRGIDLGVRQTGDFTAR
jgi:4-amino-4-deoxy-L-arabinose transferase-like glycosyltransferase